MPTLPTMNKKINFCSETRILSGIQILEELKLIKIQNVDNVGNVGNLMVSICASTGMKRELSSSEKYAYGDRLKGEFASFSQMLLSLSAKQIWQELSGELDKLHK
jgi:hypothetical protein